MLPESSMAKAKSASGEGKVDLYEGLLEPSPGVEGSIFKTSESPGCYSCALLLNALFALLC